MYWRDVVTLKAVTEGRDADGYPKEKITETTVLPMCPLQNGVSSTPPGKRVFRSH